MRSGARATAEAMPADSQIAEALALLADAKRPLILLGPATARPLRRALQKYVESPLSVQMLKGDFKPGDTVIVDWVEGKGIEFRRDEAAPAGGPAGAR